MTPRNRSNNKNRATATKKPSSLASTRIGKNELRIKYSDSHDLLRKIQSLEQFISSKHSHQLLAYETGNPVKGKTSNLITTEGVPNLLGPTRAYTIVTGCAGELDPNTKLSDIPGLDLLVFQRCVQKGVISAGYKPGSIPASPSNTLDDVITSIEGCSA